MSSRKDRTRRLARKARRCEEREAADKAAEEQRLNPPPPAPINHTRLRQIFANLSFRSHEKGGTKLFKDYVLGATVRASTPEELEARTNEFWVDEALKEKPS